MNCPSCGKEMEPGWLSGRQPLVWSPEKGRSILRERKGDVSLLEDDFAVTCMTGFPAAHICKDCRKVVVEY